MLRIPKPYGSPALALGMVLVLVLGASIIPWSREQPQAAADVQVSIEQFGRYVDGWSEPEGFFDSDNFISNETSYLHVIDDLHTRVRPGGVYLGVGPDQNFSYIAHTRPALAIVTDIRRQNMLQHLFFKVLFEKASNRAEYLALLFSKEAPAVKSDASLPDMIAALRNSPSSEKRFRDNLAAVKDTLLQGYGLQLTPDDLNRIEFVYQTFWKENLDLRFSSIGRNNSLRYPTLEDMTLETDRSGNYQSYLSSEDLFQWLKKFQSENRLIPIVGDFAGSHALRAVAAFIKSNGLGVSTFYTSNVEFYLFGSGWTRYVANVHALPLSDDAVFIRSYFPAYGRMHPLNLPGHRSTSLVQPIGRFLEEYDARGVTDVLGRGETVKLICAFLMLLLSGKEIRYFPSVLYGQILVGAGTSRYETVFTVSARKETRALLRLFADKGERMNASFVDELGKSASSGDSFEFFLTPERPVKIKLTLAPDQAADEVAVMSGWATFESLEAIEVVAVVRITTADGKLITRHVMESENPPAG